MSAPKSSSSTTGSSGVVAWRMNCHQDRPPLRPRDSWIAVRNEKPSRPIATSKMTIATSGDVSSPGWPSFSIPS